MKILAALALLLVSTLYAAPPEKAVTFMLADPELHPESTFELRFAEPMVAEDGVGKVGESPLIIKPAQTGQWKWLSTQSGVFTPTEPPPLATTFSFSLRSGVIKADGKPLKGAISAKASTPAFFTTSSYIEQYCPPEDAIEEPTVFIYFNAPVKAEDAATYFNFVDARKNIIPAKVEQGVAPKYHRGDAHGLLTWDEQFAAHRAPASKAPKKPAVNEDEEDSGEEEAESETKPQVPLHNLLRVTPSRPLPPGSAWQLVVGKGFSSADRKYKLATPAEKVIGDVLPFQVSKITASNLRKSGKHFDLEFSKELNKKLTPESLAEWIQVEPPVANLKLSFAGEFDDRAGVEIRGDFVLAKDYTVKIAPGLPGRNKLIFPKEFSKTLSFGPVPARLYFQEYSTHQQRVGTRQFHLQGINVSKFRVTAKLIRRDSVADALDRYRKYDKEQIEEDDEWYQKVDDAALTGEVVWQKDFTSSGVVDALETFALNWDEILGPGKSGTVFLTAEQPDKIAPNVKRVGTQSLVQVSDLGAVWKTSDGSFLYVFSHTTGQPISGAKLTFRNAFDKELASVTTAADGTARFPEIKEIEWLKIEHGDDQHLINFNSERGSQEFGRFRINVYGEEEDVFEANGTVGGRRGQLFGDRPVYKPGEKVHLKAVVRNFTDPKTGQPSQPVLLVTDSRARPLFDQKLTLSDEGSADVTFTLPASVVGLCNARLVFEGGANDGQEMIRYIFRVEEYVTNAYEVKLQIPPDKFSGDKMDVRLAAKYYMGKSLSKAQYLWSVRSVDDQFQPEGFRDFRFCNALADSRLENQVFGSKAYAQQGTQTLAEDGTATIDSTVPFNAKLPQPRLVRVLAEVTDLDQQTVAERQEFTLHSSEFYLGISEREDVVREGDLLPIQLVAVKKDGTPYEPAVSTKVSLTRVEWQTNRVEDADNADNYRSEPIMCMVAEDTLSTVPLRRKGRDWEAVGEPAKNERFKVTKPGLYFITAEALDAAGRKVVTCTTVHVYGREETVWNYRNRFQVDLVADKTEYHAGDEATILVKTPISGNALVTVEREGVLRHFITKLEGNAPTVRIPIKEGDAPDIFVSVVVFRGSQDSTKKHKAPEYRIGYTRLDVVRPDAELKVSVQSARPDYRPGDEVVATCNVSDIHGKPVRNAEVTFWAADEGVLSLTGFEVPNLLTTFLAPIRLDVSTGLSLPLLLNEDLETATFENKGYLIGGFGKGGEPEVRRNFLGTAFWEPSLKTDADGNVRTAFKAPDGLTRYRIMAVVHNAKDQFGRAESSFEINKPFMLEPSAPQFGRVGDQLAIRAVLHNTTKQDAEAVVKLDFDELAKSREPEKKITFLAGQSVSLDFPVEITGVGKSVWTWTGTFTPKGGEVFQDKVESRLTATYPVPTLREVLTLRVDGKEADLLAVADPALREGEGRVGATVSNSRIIELRECVNRLLTYPYGCVEQTTSAMLPWLVLRDFRGVLPELNQDDERYNAVIDRAVDKLVHMQTSSGGLAYWPGGNVPTLWGSAYGMIALSRAQQAGFKVPPFELERLRTYLSENLRTMPTTNDPGILDVYALACYALALAHKPEPAYHELLWKRTGDLSEEGKTSLALAILESDGSRKTAEALLTMTEHTPVKTGWFGSPSSLCGMRLLALTKLSPKSTATSQAADELVKLQNNGHWSTTQGNSWAMLGFSDYVRKTEEHRKEAKGTLKYGGELQAFALAAKGASEDSDFALHGKTPLQLEKTAGDRLYAQSRIEMRPKTFINERADRGYSIVRRYDSVNGDGSISELKEARVGDRVIVTLTFTVPKRATYLAIEDGLPAVFEPVHAGFKSQESAAADFEERPWMSHEEMREDRALFFADFIDPGQYVIRYLVRVRAAGTVTAPPTKIEEMYHPDRFGLGASSAITTKPLE